MSLRVTDIIEAAAPEVRDLAIERWCADRPVAEPSSLDQPTRDLIQSTVQRDAQKLIYGGFSLLALFVFFLLMLIARAFAGRAARGEQRAVIAESPFATFREVAYARFGRQFHTGPWLGRTFFRPTVDVGILYVRLRYGLNMEAASPQQAPEETMLLSVLDGGEVIYLATRNGTLRMVFKLPVMSSPMAPSPRVAPTARIPFS